MVNGSSITEDCIIAPIPAADYAKNSDDLILLPNLGYLFKRRGWKRVIIWFQAD